MLHQVQWKFGRYEDTPYQYPITISQDDQKTIWMEFDIPEGESIPGLDSKRVPICIEADTPGVYWGGFNLNNDLDPDLCDVTSVDLYWNEDWELSEYGVADSIDQILSYFSPQVEDPSTRYVLGITKIERKSQSVKDGWRWHKWGPYIGNHHPKCEYLYDEEGIDSVICFHLYKVSVCM